MTIKHCILTFLVLTSILCAENISFPPDAGIADVKRDYGAKGDGIADDTEAIQKALSEKERLIYFPNGTYLISHTLRWAESKKGTTSRQIFQGQSRDGAIIKLKDECPGFQNPSSPTEMLWTGKFPPQSFRIALRNLTLDSGSKNPGAIGARFYANNQGGVYDVRIRSGDGGGVIGLDLGFTGDQGPCLLRNVQIDGFDCGISTRRGSASVTMEFVTLQNQRVIGLDNQDHPLAIRGLKSKNSVTAIANRGNTLLTLIDTEIEGVGDAKSKPAILNDTGLLVRNLKTTGYGETIAGQRGGVTEANISEWTSHPPLSLFPSAPCTLNLPIKEVPEVPWDDPKTWISVKKFPVGTCEITDSKGHKKTVEDWSAAFQSAIDSGATTVYFPTGSYPMNGTIRIRGKVRRIIGMESSFGADATSAPSLVLADGEAPVVVVERFDWQYSETSFRHEANRTLVFSATRGSRELPFVKAKGSGDLFVTDVSWTHWQLLGGNVWARQINPEGGYKDFPKSPRGEYVPTYDMILNDSANLWILGLKTEGDGTPITMINGAKTEVLGSFIYGNKNYRPEKQWISSKDSSFSVSLVEQVNRDQPFDPVFEVRGNETRILKKGVAPGRGGGSLVVLFSGHLPTSSNPPTAPSSLTGQAAGTGAVELTWKDASDNETGFLVESSPDGVKFEQVGLANPDATHWTVVGLRAGTAMQFRVTAFNGAGQASSAVIQRAPGSIAPPGSGTGLRGDYFKGTSFDALVKTRVDPMVNFLWKEDQAVPGTGINKFSVRWTGKVESRVSEPITFQTTTDDGARLWVDGKLLIDSWESTRKPQRGQITLEAGKKVDLRFEFLEIEGAATALLQWKSKNQPEEIIPACQLYLAEKENPTISVTTPTTTLSESSSGIPVTFTRTGDTTLALEVGVVTEGTAIRDTHFKAIPASIVIPAGKSSNQLVIVPINNKRAEAANTLLVSAAPSAAYYTSNGSTELTITDDDMPSSSSGTGLNGEYFASSDFTDSKASRLDSKVDFSWEKKAPVKQLTPGKFSIRWTGEVQPLFSGPYKIALPSSPYSHVKLWIDDKPLIDAKVKDPNRYAEIELQSGKKYPVKIEYIETRNYGAKVRLVWSSANQFEEVIPATQLFPAK